MRKKIKRFGIKGKKREEERQDKVIYIRIDDIHCDLFSINEKMGVIGKQTKRFFEINPSIERKKSKSME